MYPKPLFGEDEKYDANKSDEHPLFTFFKKMAEYGYLKKRTNKWLLTPISATCGAVTHNAYCVSPNGKLYLCQHAESFKPNDSVGNVYTGVIFNKTYKNWCTEKISYKKCDECVLLPCCQGGCKSAYVYEARTPCIVFKLYYEELIKYIYENMI